MLKKLLAETIGTFWLVFGGCGAAIYAAGVPDVGIGYLGVSLAFGLTVLTMAYAVGNISGGHFNPAVTLGALIAGRLPVRDLPGYWIAQVVGSVLAAGALAAIAAGIEGFDGFGGFASNGYGALSPQGFDMTSALVIEALLTAVFIFIILATTAEDAVVEFAPIAIGLTLTLIHLVSIPVTNTSVNPARSTGVALFAETAALGQLWLFWVAPLFGAVIGAVLWRALSRDN